MEPDQLKALVAGAFSRSATTYERTGISFFDPIGPRWAARVQLLHEGRRAMGAGERTAGVLRAGRPAPPKRNSDKVGPFDSPAAMEELLRASGFAAVRHQDVELVTEIAIHDVGLAVSYQHDVG